MRGVIVQHDHARVGAIERVQHQRPDGAGGIYSDDDLDDRVTQRLGGQPRDVAIGGRGQAKRRGVGTEGTHAPCGLCGKRVRDEEHLSLPAFHAQSHLRTWGRANGETNPLPRGKVERVGRREARRVDPGDGARRRPERLGDARDERGLLLLGPGAGARHDLKSRQCVARQRDPREPGARRGHTDGESVHRQCDIAATLADAAEQERRILRLNRLGGVGIDDGDMQGLAGNGDGGVTRCDGGRAAASCRPGRNDEERGADESHVAQASGEQ